MPGWKTGLLDWEFPRLDIWCCSCGKNAGSAGARGGGGGGGIQGHAERELLANSQGTCATSNRQSGISSVAFLELGLI
jgi:hypothetical protein